MIEDILLEQQYNNILYTMEHIDDKEFELKLTNLSKIVKVDVNDLKIMAKENPVVAYVLSKSARKQNIIESMVVDKLRDKFEDIKKLTNNGLDSIRFNSDGDMVFGSKKNTKDILSKSVDFVATYNNKTYYFSQKYIHSAGGAQDNQYNDLITFITFANNNKNRDYGIGIIIDGDYFKNKMDELKDATKDITDFLIVHIDE